MTLFIGTLLYIINLHTCFGEAYIHGIGSGIILWVHEYPNNIYIEYLQF